MYSLILPTLGTREVEMTRLLESLLQQRESKLELIVVVQDNFEKVTELLREYMNKLDILIIETTEKGLSKARNIGLRYVKNNSIVVFTDDDCWYPPNIFHRIKRKVYEADITTFQIADVEQNKLFKNYPTGPTKHRSAFKIFKVSSIEIFINTNRVNKADLLFDEEFGLGAHYPSGEENNLLLDLINKGYFISYIPEVVVYHAITEKAFNNRDLYVKGAFFRRNFNLLTSLLLSSMFLMRKMHLIDRKMNGFFTLIKGSRSYSRK